MLNFNEITDNYNKIIDELLDSIEKEIKGYSYKTIYIKKYLLQHYCRTSNYFLCITRPKEYIILNELILFINNYDDSYQYLIKLYQNDYININKNVFHSICLKYESNNNIKYKYCHELKFDNFNTKYFNYILANNSQFNNIYKINGKNLDIIYRNRTQSLKCQECKNYLDDLEVSWRCLDDKFYNNKFYKNYYTDYDNHLCNDCYQTYKKTVIGQYIFIKSLYIMSCRECEEYIIDKDYIYYIKTQNDKDIISNIDLEIDENGEYSSYICRKCFNKLDISKYKIIDNVFQPELSTNFSIGSIFDWIPFMSEESTKTNLILINNNCRSMKILDNIFLVNCNKQSQYYGKIMLVLVSQLINEKERVFKEEKRIYVGIMYNNFDNLRKDIQSWQNIKYYYAEISNGYYFNDMRRSFIYWLISKNRIIYN